MVSEHRATNLYLWLDLRAIARPLPFCSISLWWFEARCGDDEPDAPCRVRHNLGPISRPQFQRAKRRRLQTFYVPPRLW
jgi:hypothetical protein